jgi:hypothetical protein
LLPLHVPGERSTRSGSKLPPARAFFCQQAVSQTKSGSGSTFPVAPLPLVY